MMFKSWLKRMYLLKIKRKNTMEILIDHLRKTGMNIGEGCCIFSDKIETTEPYLVTIGDNVMIAPNVQFTTHDASASHYIPGSSDLFGRITVGDNSFIGMGSIMLPGTSVEKDSIVGAGSVVTKKFVEPGIVIAGNPAKKICTTEDLREKNTKYALNIWGMNFE